MNTNIKHRFFYSDSIAAAWQAKHFGMQFQSKAKDTDELYWVIRFVGSIAYRTEPGSDLGFAVQEPGALYISPDSLAVLEPQAGDVVSYKIMGFDELYYGDIQKIGYADWKGNVKRKIHARAKDPSEWERVYLIGESDDWNDKVVSIIQRDGNPFFWPESEAA